MSRCALSTAAKRKAIAARLVCGVTAREPFLNVKEPKASCKTGSSRSSHGSQMPRFLYTTRQQSMIALSIHSIIKNTSAAPSLSFATDLAAAPRPSSPPYSFNPCSPLLNASSYDAATPFATSNHAQQRARILSLPPRQQTKSATLPSHHHKLQPHILRAAVRMALQPDAPAPAAAACLRSAPAKSTPASKRPPSPLRSAHSPSTEPGRGSLRIHDPSPSPPRPRAAADCGSARRSTSALVTTRVISRWASHRPQPARA
eukprot:2480857-Rhodomonas_salina.1